MAIAYLIHTNLTKGEDGVVRMTVRTPELKELLEQRSREKGVEVEITLSPAPKYFASKEVLWEYLKEKSPILKEFEEQLGLRLI